MTTATIITLNQPNGCNPYRTVIRRGPKNGDITEYRTTSKDFATIEQAEAYALKYRLNSLRYLNLAHL